MADTWNLVGCVDLGRSLSRRPPPKNFTAASSHKDTTLALAPLYSLFCVLQMPDAQVTVLDRDKTPILALFKE